MSNKNNGVAIATPKGKRPTTDFNPQCKDSKKIVNQYNRVLKKFRERPMTMKECSVEASLDRGNVCWYVRAMRLARFHSLYHPVQVPHLPFGHA